MWRRLRLSTQLMGSSLRILWHHPEFLLFPVVSAIALVLILSTLAVALLALVDFDLRAYTQLSFWGKTALWFAFYFVCYLVAFFANTGLVGAVMTYLDGGTPTLRASFGVARARSGKLIAYALIMSTVGIILHLFSGRLGLTGRLAGPVLRRVAVFTFVGLAWNLITYLVVPILVVENIGPGQAIKRSTELIKKTWGEQVVAYVSTGLIFLLFLALWTGISGPLLTRALGTFNEPFIIAALYLLIMGPLTAFLVKLAVDSLFCAVVYRYVTNADPGEFDTELLQAAFVGKPSRMFGRHLL